MTDQINELLDPDFEGEEEGFVEDQEQEQEQEQKAQETIRKGLSATLDDAQAIREANQLTQEEQESGEWVKLAEVSRECKARSIPVSRLVKATGGDRALEPAVEGFEVAWVGRVRYLHQNCLSEEAMDFLTNEMGRQPKSTEVEQTFDAWKKAELIQLAGEYEIALPSKAKKAEIIQILVDSGLDPLGPLS